MSALRTKDKEQEERLESLRGGLVDAIGKALESDDPLDKSETEKREKEVGEISDLVVKAIKESNDAETAELKARVEELEKLPDSDPRSLAGGKAHEGGRETKAGFAKVDRYKGDNVFMDMRAAATGDSVKAQEVREYLETVNAPDRVKAWATGDLEDADLVMPDIQAALPFLHDAANIVPLFREIRISGPSVEFPRYTSGLTVGVVPELTQKPDSDPTFTLENARAHTIAGTTQVPNQTLEDYPAARAWIASELGYAVGEKENALVTNGTGIGMPLGLLQDPDVPGRAPAIASAKAAIEQIFVSMQRVRKNGRRSPSDIVMSIDTWTVIAMAFEAGVGWLYGRPAGDGAAPTVEPKPRLLGLPVTQDVVIPDDQGDDDDESPTIVGNFQDGVVFRRSPFRVDVDTSLGFRDNSTWFRGEERMGYLTVRPDSFEVLETIKPSVIGPALT